MLKLLDFTAQALNLTAAVLDISTNEINVRHVPNSRQNKTTFLEHNMNKTQARFSGCGFSTPYSRGDQFLCAWEQRIRTSICPTAVLKAVQIDIALWGMITCFAIKSGAVVLRDDGSQKVDRPQSGNGAGHSASAVPSEQTGPLRLALAGATRFDWCERPTGTTPLGSAGGEACPRSKLTLLGNARSAGTNLLPTRQTN
jgi:hypothetical protein